MDITCYEHTIANTTNPDPGLMYSPVNIFQGLICMFVGFTIYKIYTYEKRNFPNILQVVASTKEQLASTKEHLTILSTKLQTDLTILSTQTNEFKTNSNAGCSLGSTIIAVYISNIFVIQFIFYIVTFKNVFIPVKLVFVPQFYSE